MSLHTMPFLILNLGVEMMFVLNSRLHAQQVAPDKAAIVLGDIGTNIFGKEFLDELFKPQPMYSSASVSQVFTALSTSSVMRLAENSLRKLYDLVYMTVKYQVFTQRHPLELLELTLNHLDAAQQMLTAAIQPLVSEAENRVLQLAAGLHVGDWANARRELLNFFIDRHVRVSVFLEIKVQDSGSGAFYIPRDTFLSPMPACKPPGLVHMTGVPQPGTFVHPDAQLPYPPHIPLGSWTPRRGAPRLTKSGFDMYTRAALATSSKASTATGAAGVASGISADPTAKQAREVKVSQSRAADAVGDVSAPPGPTTQSPSPVTTAEQQRAYDAELNYLAQLIGSANRADDVQEFELDLFPDGTGSAAETVTTLSESPTATASRASAAHSRGVAVVEPSVPIARMTASAVRAQNQQLLGIMNEFQQPPKTIGGGAAAETGGKTMCDLLDIMDEL
ncbi:hypothetical protein JKF63_05512 [Porcisia hertigi]|uniref:Uncharacterized protein n=1 Tax=Porcisia hertigi TaxID=2761500 RepID=A0A836IVZ5_9TRYP|nr:hypothetical protein JKF63_05512 [Porcisia hertigi]